MFHEFWRQGLLEYDEVVGIDWAWLAGDGAMTKAPLGGRRLARTPLMELKGAKRPVLAEGAVPDRARPRRRQPERPPAKGHA